MGGGLSRRRRRRGVLALEHGTVRAGEHSNAARGQRRGRECGGVAGRRGSNGAATGAASSGGEGAVRAGGSERRPGACALEQGRGVSGALKCPRAQIGEGSEGEREEREKGSGERKTKVNRLT